LKELRKREKLLQIFLAKKTQLISIRIKLVSLGMMIEFIYLNKKTNN